jgi:hypothetical protein
MKRLAVLLFIISGTTFIARAQFKPPALDKSPMDMCYYPNNYPVLKVQNKVTEPLLARIVYSRPQKNGRQVFGELVEYGQVWRLGANEATEIEVYKDCKVNGQKLKKGRYTLYAIPFQDRWTIIFNKETDIWGAFLYDAKKDILRTDIKTELLKEPAEAFSMGFEKADSSINLVIAWDNVKANLPFTF